VGILGAAEIRGPGDDIVMELRGELGASGKNFRRKRGRKVVMTKVKLLKSVLVCANFCEKFKSKTTDGSSTQ